MAPRSQRGSAFHLPVRHIPPSAEARTHTQRLAQQPPGLSSDRHLPGYLIINPAARRAETEGQRAGPLSHTSCGRPSRTETTGRDRTGQDRPAGRQKDRQRGRQRGRQEQTGRAGTDWEGSAGGREAALQSVQPGLNSQSSRKHLLAAVFFFFKAKKQKKMCRKEKKKKSQHPKQTNVKPDVVFHTFLQGQK